VTNTNEEPTQHFEVRGTSDNHFGWIRIRLCRFSFITALFAAP
jgi:hypothetical protein